MTLGAVTIDLDSVSCYHAIHGLPEPSGPDPLLTKALPRFLELCGSVGVSATLFCVGRDLKDASVARLLAQAHAAGHEVANHSHSHDYRLSRWTPAAIRADLDLSADAIAEVTGVRPVGFRAPGYNLGTDMLPAVAASGHLYDSSIFPSWPYFLARGVALASYAASGTPSRSLLGDAREFTAPRRPYRPARQAPFRPAAAGEAEAGVWELPIAVALPMALPMIGTFLPMYPRLVRKLLSAWRVRAGGPFNLELHAMDFADGADGLHPALVERQVDLKLPLKQRMETLRGVITSMSHHLDLRPLRQWLTVLVPPLTGRARQG